MSVDTGPLLDRVCEMIAGRLDGRRIELAKRRHADVLAGREADYLPMIHAAPVPEEARDWPDFGWDERFHDPAKSLFMQLRQTVLPYAGTRSDFVPGVRADLGTINCQTIFGAEWRVTPANRSVITRYVPKEQLAAFELPEDISGLGVMPRIVEHVQHHVEALRRGGLGGLVGVHHCDQQGPFDIAAMTRGHDIFLDLHEDGQFVHRLMGLCARAYVAVSKLCKRLAGEPVGGPGNAVGIWMEAGAVRMCGDSEILVGAAAYREFIQPYARRAFEELGGGWHHYCGGWAGTGRSEGLHLHEAYAEIGPSLKGLNWTTARDWMAEMRRLRELGLVHVGTVPRRDQESLEAYFRRILGVYDGRRGLILGGMWQDPVLYPGEYDRAMDVWHAAQDEVFP